MKILTSKVIADVSHRCGASKNSIRRALSRAGVFNTGWGWFIAVDRNGEYYQGWY